MTTLHDVGGVLGRPLDTSRLGSHNLTVMALALFHVHGVALRNLDLIMPQNIPNTLLGIPRQFGVTRIFYPSALSYVEVSNFYAHLDPKERSHPSVPKLGKEWY